MLEEAERLDDLVEALLTLARGESREFSPKLESVRVGDIVNEVREEIAILATEKQQTISVSGEEGLTALADRSLLRQALLNILFNAVHYSPVGSAIRMGCCRESNGVSITVADEGPVSKRSIVHAFSSASSALIKRDREPKGVRVWGWRSQR
jgi:signal transduction histidine kinase